MSSAKIACMNNPLVGGMGGPRTIVGPSAPRRNVCKNLFGTPDRTNSFASDRMRELLAKSSKTWNYDFERDRPLEGRYEWELVQDSHSATTQSSSGGTSVPNAYALNRMMSIGSGRQLKSSSCKLEASQAKYYEPERVPKGPLLIVAEDENRVLPRASATTTSIASQIKSQSFTTEIRKPTIVVEEQSGTSVNNPETCLNPSQEGVLSSEESESSRESTSHESSSNVQVKQKRQRQTQLSDYFKSTKYDVGLGKKRRAESPSTSTTTTAPPEKKATL